MLFLARFQASHAGWLRKGSPAGGSILITSAPKSARTAVASPPAMPQLKSKTTSPLHGPAMYASYESAQWQQIPCNYGRCAPSVACTCGRRTNRIEDLARAAVHSDLQDIPKRPQRWRRASASDASECLLGQ